VANSWALTKQQKTVDTYLKGCVNLYGYVTPRQFLKVYNRYNTPKIKKDDLLKWGYKLERHSYDSYKIYMNAIVNTRVPDEKIQQILYFQHQKKYYTPTEQEILAYSDNNYYEKNHFVKELYSFLVANVKTTPIMVNLFISKLCWLIKTEESMAVMCKLIELFGFEIEDEKLLNILLLHIQNLNNNSRKWANCGYTPTEIITGYADKK
jgi:hypothetical protein